MEGITYRVVHGEDNGIYRPYEADDGPLITNSRDCAQVYARHLSGLFPGHVYAVSRVEPGERMGEVLPERWVDGGIQRSFGPLKVPQIGREVRVELHSGEVLEGTVADHFEDGTGYVLSPNDEMVEIITVWRWDYAA